jgi:hypothetical protein
MGNVKLNKAPGVFETIILPVLLLPFAIEESKGLCLVLLLVVSSPIFDDFDDPVRHREGGDHTGFIDDIRVDVEDLVCALAIAIGTEEYPREHARAHSVGNGWIIAGFDIGSIGGLAVFFEIKLRPRLSCGGSICLIPQQLLGGYSARELHSIVDKVDNNLAGELSGWEVRHECTTALLNSLDVVLNFPNVFMGCSSV